MDTRKDFLDRLEEWFGNCGRGSFLQKLRAKFCTESSDVSQITDALLEKPDVLGDQAIDINGTDAWRKHVECLRDISVLSECLDRHKLLLRKSNMADYKKSIKNSLDGIPAYVDKHFKEPQDIDEETTEEVASQTGKLVKEIIGDLLRGCHIGIKHSQGAEQNFYKDFAECIEQYLSSAKVFQKEIFPGMNVKEYARWFEKPCPKQAENEEQVGMIDEIEVNPHYIAFRNENNDFEELIIKGICIVFGETKKK